MTDTPPRLTPAHLQILVMLATLEREIGPAAPARPQQAPARHLTPDPRRYAPSRLFRAAAGQLAAALWHAHAHGWQALPGLHCSYARPGAASTPAVRGYIVVRDMLLGSPPALFDLTVWSSDYHDEVAQLPEPQRRAIRIYYQRNPARGDAVPALDESQHAAQREAFAALLARLLACQGKSC